MLLNPALVQRCGDAHGDRRCGGARVIAADLDVATGYGAGWAALRLVHRFTVLESIGRLQRTYKSLKSRDAKRQRAPASHVFFAAENVL